MSGHPRDNGGGQYPYAPTPWGQPDNREKTLEAENERLPKAYEHEGMRRDEAEAKQEQDRTFRPADQIQTASQHRAPYTVGLAQSRHAPSVDDTDADQSPPQDYQTNLLEELTRLNMTLARNQTQDRGATGLKPNDVGLFEPKTMPDSEAAMDFIDDFRGAAIHYGEERVVSVLRKCCKNRIARTWLAGMNDRDRIGLSQALDNWEHLLRRDFMPRPTQLYAEAKAEVFKWTQNRAPAEYITHKLRLLRLAGITNENLVVEELHAGFARCTEMHIPLEPFVLAGSDVEQYRRAAQSLQTSARLQYEYGQQSRSPYGTDNRREKISATAKQSTADKEQATNTLRSYPRKDATTSQRGDKRPIVRKRKCRNYPHCGNGEHFDWECTKRSNEPTRAYYASAYDESIGTTDFEEGLDIRETDSDLEEEYEQQQNAYIATIWRAERGFMGTTVARKPTIKSKPLKRIPPKPSECRKCHVAFPSRNQLHRHVSETGHNVQTARPIIESTLHAHSDGGSDQTSTLASFHYAKAEFMLLERDQHTSLACVDSGYGNSAVDKRFLETQVHQPTYRDLDVPVVVRGIGGAKVSCTQVAIFPVYWPTLDGRLAKITRPYHIFPDLGCDLLVGIDTIYTERIDLFFSSAVPQMRLGTCEGAAVKISVFKKQLIRRIPVRAAKRTVIPANSTTIVEIKLGKDLPQDQNYIFTPSKLRTVTTVGAGAPHGIFSCQQASVLFTNVNDKDITIVTGESRVGSHLLL
jgi:hypothetical protein